MLDKNKKRFGVSPVIATVLLVAMTVVIALIVFIWFRQIGKETIMKLGENVELVCGDVSFRAEYVNNQLLIVNEGNIPIYGIVLKVGKNRGFQTYDLRNDIPSSGWKDSGLLQGGSFISQDLSAEISGADSLVVVPVLLGESDKGERTHVCDEKQFGQEVVVA
ncbi:MAG: archaellin/type IV pilin N-terminal domain-containing protein [Nanoarchaeota archaeon]